VKVGSFPSYSVLLSYPFFYSSNKHHGALDVLRIMVSAKNPRMPFPSFTLALSRQKVGDNESNNSIQERNASNVEPPVDLMVSL
jgi:hypothetical protein